MSCDIVRKGQQALRPTTGDFQRASVLVDIAPNALHERANVVEQEQQKDAIVGETQQANRRMPNSHLLSPEAPPKSAQYMASNVSPSSDPWPISKQVAMTEQISGADMLGKDNTEDGTEFDVSTESETDRLEPVGSFLELPPVTIAPDDEPTPMDARSLACAEATRSLDDSEVWQASEAHIIGSALTRTALMPIPGSETIRPLWVTVVDDQSDSDEVDHKRSEVMNSSSSAFITPKKSDRSCSSTSDEREELEEPPTKRRRTRRSLRSTRDPASDDSLQTEEQPTIPRRMRRSIRSIRDFASDGSLPSNIELLVSAHVRLDDKIRNFFDRKGVSILQDFKRRPADQSTLVHVIPDKGPFRTLKILRTMTANGTVVTRSWVRDSMRKSNMQPLQAYVPSVLKTSIDLDRTSVFEGKMLIFSPTAQNEIRQWKEVCALATEAGCAKISVASHAQIMSPPSKSTICLFGDNSAGDTNAADWIRSHGRVVWDWHLLARAILAGRLDLEDDHYKLSLPLGSRLIEYEY